jgi:hypothetical protein
MADVSTANLLRDYLGFGTGFALGVLVFFFAALAFCFCAACLCVAFGDLSPMSGRVRSLTNGVNTDQHRSDEIPIARALVHRLIYSWHMVALLLFPS